MGGQLTVYQVIITIFVCSILNIRQNEAAKCVINGLQTKKKKLRKGSEQHKAQVSTTPQRPLNREKKQKKILCRLNILKKKKHYSL